MINRYQQLILLNETNNKEYLVDFCDTALTLDNPDKLSRWVGFIQGVLYERGMIDVTVERDFSRELYRPVYDRIGYNSNTVDLTTKEI
jgi:hypothetical protein